MKPSELPDRGGLFVVVDTETSGLFRDDGARLSVVSIAYRDTSGGVVAEAFPFDQGRLDKDIVMQGDLLEVEAPNLPREEWDRLLDWLSRQRLIFQNAKFDLHHLYGGTRKWPGRELIDCLYWDTMVASKELWPLENTSLKATAERLGLTGGGERDEEKAIKAWLRKAKVGTGRYDLIPWDILGPYATQDAVLTLLLWERQVETLDGGEGSRAIISQKLRVTRQLYLLEKRGMGYDAASSLQAAGELERVATELKAELPFDGTVNGGKRYWFKEQGVVPYATTEKKGEAKLDEEVIAKMVRDGIPWAKEYAEVRKIETALSMWYRGYPEMIGSDGRLRCSFRQTKVVSGRLSVERVQLQAIPHDHRLSKLPEGIPPVRQLFRARDGHKLWELDLSQAELRVAAKMARCGTLLSLVEGGQDAHGHTAMELFDTDYKDDRWFFYRQIAKRGNFSLIFGVGADTFRATLAKLADVHISREESQRIVTKWKKLYPEFEREIHRSDRSARRDGYVRLVNGEPSWFAPHEQTHKAFNRRVQGSLAILNMEWLLAVEDRWPESAVMSIHDSIVLELPDDAEGERIAKKAAALGAKLGTQMFGCRMEAEVKEWHAKH